MGRGKWGGAREGQGTKRRTHSGISYAASTHWTTCVRALFPSWPFSLARASLLKHRFLEEILPDTTVPSAAVLDQIPFSQTASFQHDVSLTWMPSSHSCDYVIIIFPNFYMFFFSISIWFFFPIYIWFFLQFLYVFPPNLYMFFFQFLYVFFPISIFFFSNFYMFFFFPISITWLLNLFFLNWKLSSSLSPPFFPGWYQPDPFLRHQPLNDSLATLTLSWQSPAHAQSCLTPSRPTDCSLTGSSVHRTFQARVLEWVAISSSMESSRLRDWTLLSCVSCLGRWILYPLSHRGSAQYFSL